MLPKQVVRLTLPPITSCIPTSKGGQPRLSCCPAAALDNSKRPTRRSATRSTLPAGVVLAKQMAYSNIHHTRSAGQPVWETPIYRCFPHLRQRFVEPASASGGACEKSRSSLRENHQQTYDKKQTAPMILSDGSDKVAGALQ